MATGGKTPNRPMPARGNPAAEKCRHCEGPKLLVRGALLCEKCDAPMVDGVTLRPTWKPRLA